MENIVRFATFLAALGTLLLVYDLHNRPGPSTLCQQVAQAAALKCDPLPR